MPLARNPVFSTMQRQLHFRELMVTGDRRGTVKAIRAHSFGGPEVLQLETVDDPVPGLGEVVVEVGAAGVNPADTYMRSGTYAIRPELPYTPGGDAGGVICAKGPDVTHHKVGDRVFVGTALSFDLTGCYAEKVKRRASEVLPLAEGISFAQAATFGVSYPTAHYALFERGGAKAGETVFIHGASGSVGSSAIQLAKRAGLRVVGSAGTAKGLELVRAEGVDHAVNHTEAGYMNDVRRVTGGNGPELILEMLANVNLAADMDLAAKYGRIIVIGNRGEITVNPRVAMMKELDIRGIALWNATAAQIEPIMRDILAGVADGSLRPVVSRKMRLSEAAAAHLAVLEHGIGGKIVLIPE
jgi:NADPH2:quinone reductase